MKYKIGEIFIDDGGAWWCDWWGEHAEQGGINFTKGNAGSEDLKDLFSWVEPNMTRCKDIYLKEIKRKGDDGVK